METNNEDKVLRRTQVGGFQKSHRREESKSRRIEAPRPPNRQVITWKTNNEDEVLLDGTKIIIEKPRKLSINEHVEFVFRKFLNFVKMSGEIMKVDKSEDSLTPFKAF